MPIKLPRLTWELDCEPLGYPGLVITFWLNPPRVDEEEDESPKKRPAWDGAFYRYMALVIDRLDIPTAYMAGEAGEVVRPGSVEIPDAKALYELERDAGFDPQILLWAARRYQEQRVERLQAESKN